MDVASTVPDRWKTPFAFIIAFWCVVTPPMILLTNGAGDVHVETFIPGTPAAAPEQADAAAVYP